MLELPNKLTECLEEDQYRYNDFRGYYVNIYIVAVQCTRMRTIKGFYFHTKCYKVSSFYNNYLSLDILENKMR